MCQTINISVNSQSRKNMKLICCLLVLLGVALASIIPNCYIQNIVDQQCLVCEVGWKKVDGLCNICDQGYQMKDNKCVLINSLASQNTTQTQAQNTQLSQTTQQSTGSLTTQNTQTSQNSLNTQTAQSSQTTTSGSNIPVIVSQTIPGFIVIQNPCTGFDSNGKCQGCISGYTLTNGACLLGSSSTSSSTSSTTSSSQTSSSSSNQSSTQSSATTQTTNLTPSSILSSIMQSNPTTIPSTVSVVSQSTLNEGCSQYNTDNGTCVKCADQYHRDPSVTTQVKCLQNNPRCKNYTETYTCKTCYDGFTVINGDCIVVVTQTVTVTSSDPNCKTSVNGSCGQCYTGFYLDINTKKCEIANPLCKEVNSDNTCLSCFGGYLKYLGQCIDPSKFNLGSPDWTIFYFSIPASVTSSSIGYADPNCKTYQNGNCVQCADRCYPQGGSCHQVSPDCNHYNNQTGACTDCYKGYTLVNNTCIPFQSQTPQTCPYRSVSINSTCVEVSGLCKAWDATTALCTKCYLGYSQENGICKRTI